VEVLYDRGAFDALATPHKRFHSMMPYDAYRSVMARCEIALMPLDDTFFNRCKSDLKFVEAGAHRLCCLASPVVYAGTIRDGETGIIMRDPAEMAAALRALLAAPERARTIGDAARRWVAANRMVASQVKTRLAWYRSLWERRAELDAALLARAPELR
jgi:glycosyltransferase involved in cell wall biosynthesis